MMQKAKGFIAMDVVILVNGFGGYARGKKGRNYAQTQK